MIGRNYPSAGRRSTRAEAARFPVRNSIIQIGEIGVDTLLSVSDVPSKSRVLAAQGRWPMILGGGYARH